jgi:peptide methionine sulfoxide reductase MsrA
LREQLLGRRCYLGTLHTRAGYTNSNLSNAINRHSCNHAEASEIAFESDYFWT